MLIKERAKASALNMQVLDLEKQLSSSNTKSRELENQLFNSIVTRTQENDGSRVNGTKELHDVAEMANREIKKKC